MSEAHIKVFYNKSKDVETLKFNKNKDLSLFELSFDFCQPLHGIENWKWSFNNETQILNLYSDNKQQITFKIIKKVNK